MKTNYIHNTEPVIFDGHGQLQNGIRSSSLNDR